MHTVEEIKNMTDEEISDLNKKLGVKALKQFGLFFMSKWALIMLTTYLLKKWIQSLPEE